MNITWFRRTQGRPCLKGTEWGQQRGARTMRRGTVSFGAAQGEDEGVVKRGSHVLYQFFSTTTAYASIAQTSEGCDESQAIGCRGGHFTWQGEGVLAPARLAIRWSVLVQSAVSVRLRRRKVLSIVHLEGTVSQCLNVGTWQLRGCLCENCALQKDY